MKAVLVVCEGLHEIIFVQRSLGAVGGCKWFDDPIRDMPSPFGKVPQRSDRGLIATRIERNVESLTFREAAYTAPPHFESAVFNNDEETMFVLIRANGKQQAGAVTDLLQDLDASLEVGPVDVTEYAVAFLFDANDDGLQETLDGFRKGYQEHFGNLAMASHAHWLPVDTCHIGVFVVHRSPEDPFGTLEDHLAPMVAAIWPERYDSARDFIDSNRNNSDTASRNDAARLKAVITSAAQFQHPGAPLSTVVARDGLPRGQFERCQLSQDLVRFLQAVPWR